MADDHYIISIGGQHPPGTVGQRDIVERHAGFESKGGYDRNGLVGNERNERILRLILYSFLVVFSMLFLISL